MTEEEWLACTEPITMLAFVRGKTSERKLRLVAAACCRKIWHLFRDNQDPRAVQLAEQLADGEVEVAAVELFRQGIDWSKPGNAKYVLSSGGSGAVHCVLQGVEDSLTAEGAAAEAKRALSEEGETAEEARQAGLRAYTKALTQVKQDVQLAHAHLFRDIINPFSSFSLSPTWQTSTVWAIAHAAYEERGLPSGTLDQACLAVLADALEEAGCTNADVLGHLRSADPHFRGCWALDAVLGKE